MLAVKVLVACFVAPIVLFAAAAFTVWLYDHVYRLIKCGGVPPSPKGSSSLGRPYNQDDETDWWLGALEEIQRLPEVR